MKSSKLAVLAALAGLVVPLGPLATGGAAAAIDPATLGNAPETAAGSCWEIKQVRPTAASGAYWLLTPRMAQPAQFYCDMVTDGGGWVLVAKGRDGWTDAYEGQGDLSTLLSPGLSPMGPKTTQYPADTVDDLLNGGRVDALSEGIRLRRARNTGGTAWQEVRFKMSKRDRWVWSFGAEHGVSSFSFDGAGGTGGQTASFGSDNSLRRVVSRPQQSQKYRLGFAYGTQVTGSSSATAFLWSSTNGAGGALPYTEVFIRPRVVSSSGFTALPDSGVAGKSRPATFKNRALDSPWGVTGIAGNTATEGNVEVQAFIQSGDTMYVGGNFASVQSDGNGTGRVSQPFLAAFDVNSGQWESTFRPVLNEQVHALAKLPDGSIVAGGEFTRSNGVPAAGAVVLDPVTGANSTAHKITIENQNTGKVIVRALDVSGSWLYIGGSFTRMAGGTRTAFTPTQNMGRVSVTNGTPDTAWNPKLNGTVNDVEVPEGGSRAYVVGYFGKANGVTANRAAVLTTGTGAGLASPFNVAWSSTRNNYQRAVEVTGNRLYIGGSEHSLFGFDTGSLQRVSGSIAKTHGDVQAIGTAGLMVYAGCHCDDYVYENAYSWPTLGNTWTQGDSIGWLAAFDAATGRQVPNFTPVMKSRLGSGTWAIMADTTGTLWVGGDFQTATTKSKAGQWTGGFVRFEPTDSTAPATPSQLTATSTTATTVTLSWKTVGDTGGGGVRYQILRDDRPIAFTTGNVNTLTVPRGGSDRFFVRATDAAGNVSATSPVLTVG